MKTLKSKEAPEPIGPYSQAVESGGFLFLSGQIGLKPESAELPDTLEEQTRQIIKNISAVLNAGGCSLSDVVKTTVYLKNMSDFAKFNAIYAEYFKNNPPARSTVEVSGLPRNALIEIEIIARK
ncbi:MAG TPA: RidA family protein [Candidatus Kryptonia bacterium]